MWILILAGLMHLVIVQDPGVNTMCPVMPDEQADPEITVQYNGKTVALCCDGCVKKFTENPEKYLANLPQFAAPLAADAPAPGPMNRMCPVMTDEQADPEITVEYRGKTVALCCDGCVKKFTENPEKYLANLPQFADGPAEQGGDVRVASEPPRMPLIARLHPVIIHVPIAAIPLALLALIASSVDRRGDYARADVIPLLAAAVAAIAAYISGDIALEHKRYSDSMMQLAERHETCSTVVLVLVLLLAVLRVWRWNGLVGAWRGAYAVGLVSATAAVGLTGYLGGSLVFGTDHLF